MHFADLTAYEYGPKPDPAAKVKNVGWLDAPHTYPRGDVPPEVVERLKMLVTRAITQPMGGFHTCTLPHADDVPVRGNGEIIVVGGDGTHYHAPELVHHYVTVHQYQPPPAFIDAVMRTAHISWPEARRDDLCLACGQRMVFDEEFDHVRFLHCPACRSFYVRLGGPPGPRLLYRPDFSHNRTSEVLLDADPVCIMDRWVEPGDDVADAHARIERRGDRHWLVDLRGTTEVNGTRVPGEQALAHRDYIRCGTFDLSYVEE